MQNKVEHILKLLNEHYPQDGKCFLNYNEDWQLLIATILSAQCTDNRVNIVTKTLFEKYKTIEQFASANILELEQDIRSTGFYRNKAKNIIACTAKLLTDFNGSLPSDIKNLTSLSGVGRKTANVVRSHIFKIPSVVVDTHVKRISNRLKLTKNSDPVKIEFDLMEILPESSWINFNQQVISHGRKICMSRNPKCIECCFLDLKCSV